ncbi:MAG: hypothetical protein IPP31_13515 [Chitinophagaceae bacterium]|nr:hypothetical protein [Chitinophagaceae bacterium]
MITISSSVTPMWTISLFPDKHYILTGSGDYSALLWNLDGIAIQRFTGHYLDVTSVAFSPDGKNIATGSDDRTVRIWELAMPVRDFLKSDKIEALTKEQKTKYNIQ